MFVKKIILLFILIYPIYGHTEGIDLNTAILNTKENCSGIKAELDDMKKLAGINTTITGAGTLAGGVAVYTGIKKNQIDTLAESISKQLEKIETMSDEEFLTLLGSLLEYEEKQKQLAELNDKSKSMGNLRTGLMVGNTATNIAGAVISNKNQTNDDLKSRINNCTLSIENLRNTAQQARLDGQNITQAEKIIDACSKYDTLNTSDIDQKANISKWSSIFGATTGTAGTVTSIMSNTDNTRSDDTDSGKKKEKNLNTASNVLAVGSTAASATSTIFNATQIKAIKQASEIADKCEDAIK